MGQVTPWRYSSTGNESIERATGRLAPRFLPSTSSSTPTERFDLSSIHSLGLFAARYEFLPRAPGTISCDHETHCGGRSESPPRTIPRLDESSGKEVATAGGRKGEEYRAVCRVSGNVSCLAGGCRLSGMYSVLVRSLASCRD